MLKPWGSWRIDLKWLNVPPGRYVESPSQMRRALVFGNSFNPWPSPTAGMLKHGRDTEGPVWSDPGAVANFGLRCPPIGLGPADPVSEYR